MTTPNDIVETERKRARTGWDNIMHHVSAEALARLTATLISKPNLTPAERTLGDYVMQEVSAG